MFLSEDNVEIPCVDVLTWAFGNEDYDQEKPIWIDAYNPDISISAREARTMVRRLIGGFKDRALKPGDTVCVHSYNNIWYPILYLAIIGTGGRYIGSNPAYKTFELIRLLALSETKYLIIDPFLVPKVWTSAIKAGVEPWNIFAFDDQDQLTPASTLSFWKVLLRNEEEPWYSIKDEALARQTTAALLLTSGTGGLPKAAMMSHYAIVAQAVLASHAAKHLPPQVKRLISLPFFHSFVLPFHLLALRHGQQTYVMPRFKPEDYAGFVDHFHITSLPLVPPMALALFNPPFSTRHSYSSLHEIICAGLPLGGDVQSQLTTCLQPYGKFYQLWGMTELGWLSLSRYPGQSAGGSSGKLLPNTSARLVDAEGNEILEERRQGEILIKNSGTMAGYLGKPQATVNCFIEGWFKTGDVGYCDNGEWYIVDRVKDLIKVRGWQVSPAEIEACLLTHPHVKDAAVIGIAAKTGIGEVPSAYIVTDSFDLSDLDPGAEIQSYVRQRLASYKALDGGVKFISDIPRTVSGKILRRFLREESRPDA